MEISVKNYLSDTNDFKFEKINIGHVNQLNVFHKGNRVAIVEGIDGSLLRWVCDSDKISIKNIDKLERMISRAFNKAIKEK